MPAPWRSGSVWLGLIVLLGAAGPFAAAERGDRSTPGTDPFAVYKERHVDLFPRLPPRAGEPALDATGLDLTGRPVRLASLWIDRPVVLEFGTCT
jgi:hypothetical protein